MKRLVLLFTKDGLQYQILKGKSVMVEDSFFINEENQKDFISQKLDMILTESFTEIQVISALNHFSMMPKGFEQHDLGYDIIAYNANVDKEQEELMLAINNRFRVQFYYTLPKIFYYKIKEKKCPIMFNFSGEKFLSNITMKGKKEVHINLYHNQCEFFALENKQLKLYNNLDISSEVDFLYFIMFTLSKIGFGTSETQFFVYGETTENDTFISELQKFVKRLKIVFDNLPKKNFIMK